VAEQSNKKPGSLRQKFNSAFHMDQGNLRQMKGSAATILAAYGGLAAYGLVNPSFFTASVKNFDVNHLPLHGVFILVASAVGASCVAAYDHFYGPKKQASKNVGSKPAAPSA
jgi:hypothetical protein